MTDRELLESLMKTITANQSQINNIECKIDQFIKEHKAVLYGYGRNDKYASK